MSRELLDSILNYENILKKVMKATSLKNESTIAKRLNITPQSLSVFKRQGKLPAGLVIQMSLTFKISLDWLLTGDADVFTIDMAQKSDDTPKEEMINWIDDFWSRTNDDEKSWLKVQFKKSFPEYIEWLDNKTRAAKGKKQL